MPREDAIRVVRVFLASPGDLRDERQAARRAVDEVNKTVARPSGFHVDLIGWEDTLSTAGRPQAIINEDLDTCQMFIGVLWGRWGTPPDTAGAFTSGFEEEFSLATAKNERLGEPHMSMFFKDVDEAKLADPGPELSRVLSFKKRIINEKKLLFESFSNVGEFEAKIRLGVADFIHRLDRIARAGSGPGSAEGQRSEDSNDSSPVEPRSADTDVEAEFLSATGRAISSRQQTLTPSEVARIRLIGMAAGHPGNDEGTIGAHDANLLYENRADMVFSAREITALADAGVEASGAENKPLWTWLAKCMERFPPWLTYTSITGSDRQQVGALRVMAALGGQVTLGEGQTEESIAQVWFGENASADVRNAALEFIAERDDGRWLKYAEQELERNDYSTRKASLEAIILVKGRISSREAALFASTTSLDSIGEKATDLVLRGMAELDDNALSVALESRFGAIRKRAIELISERGKADEATLIRFFGDPSVDVRIAAVAAFESAVRLLERSEAEAALVRKQGRLTLGLLGSNVDTAGQNAFVTWRRQALARSPLHDLREDGPHSVAIEDRVAAQVIGHLSAVRSEIRNDFDDRYRQVSERYVEMIRSHAGTGEKAVELVRSFENHQDLMRKSLMRIALDGVERAGDVRDLPRVRRALDEEVCDSTTSDIEYLAKAGEWEDIARIGRIVSNMRGSFLFESWSSTQHIDRAISAVIKLAGKRIAEVMRLDLPNEVLAGVVAAMPSSWFRQLSTDLIDTLLVHKDAKVRKATALKSLLVLKTADIRGCFDRHIHATGTRYYNVFFWLDLSRAFSREKLRGLAERELLRFRT